MLARKKSSPNITLSLKIENEAQFSDSALLDAWSNIVLDGNRSSANAKMASFSHGVYSYSLFTSNIKHIRNLWIVAKYAAVVVPLESVDITHLLYT
jgi:hypothetical protein